MTSDGQLNLQINFLREKTSKQVLRDMIVKLEANFLRDYDDESYRDSYENMEYLFHTYTQVDKFLGTVEGYINLSSSLYNHIICALISLKDLLFYFSFNAFRN